MDVLPHPLSPGSRLTLHDSHWQYYSSHSLETGNCAHLSNLSQPFPGYESLQQLVDKIPRIAQLLLKGHQAVEKSNFQIMATAIQRDWLRVPLDHPRRRVRSLPWRTHVLSQLKVGTTAELIPLLAEIRTVQEVTKNSLILLVDMKIHYALAKLLYGRSFSLVTRQGARPYSHVFHFYFLSNAHG
jgi:hypothetical protein